MRYLILVTFMLFSAQIFGQKNSLDLSKIQQNFTTQDSSYSSQRLLYKFKGMPITLNKEEARHLYFGRNFSEIISFENSDFKQLAEFYHQKNADECIRLGKELYQKDPTNLDILMILLNTYTLKKNQKQFNLHLAQFQLLINTIKQTGDGKSGKTAFVVNSAGDEYILLKILTKGEKYERKSKMVKDGVLDIWKKNKEKIYIKVLYL